jgi:hypothetical protein
LAYQDYSKVFEIYTGVSSKQLGAVITQDNRFIAFFSWKLSNTQRKYSITKIELLAIVETLTEFKGMLWGLNIEVFTDHANLMSVALGLTSDRACHAHRNKLMDTEDKYNYMVSKIHIFKVHIFKLHISLRSLRNIYSNRGFDFFLGLA